MKTAALVVSVSAVLAGISLAPTAEAAGEQDDHGHKASSAASCQPDVHLTQAAEKQLGGALYEGPMSAQTSKSGESAPAGAHMEHHAQHGGTFFMAPNKTHHIEASYSQECGFRLFIFNAFTKPISTRRFQAFIKFVPEDEYEFEAIRFLSLTEDGSILQTRGDHGIEGPFNIELYLKFPGSDKPELFNIQPQTAAKRFYDGVGVVVAVEPSGNRLVVDHEQIAGFMGAMEMSYVVTPATLLQGVKPGDKVRFTIDADKRMIVNVVPLDE